METFSVVLAIFAGNSPVPDEFPTQRPVTRSFDVCLDLRLNKRLSKQSLRWWFETLSRPLWRHCNVCNTVANGIKKNCAWLRLAYVTNIFNNRSKGYIDIALNKMPLQIEVVRI